MSYIIKKSSPEPTSRRIIISSPDTRSLQNRKYVVKNRDSSLNSFRYVDNDYDGYISDGPVIVQKPTPRTVIVQQEPPQPKKYVYVEDDVDDDDDDIQENDEETLYYIDGKYYKSRPQLQNPVQNVVYVNKPQPQRDNVVYYVDEDDDDEYDDPVDEAPIIQKKIIINKKPKPIQAPPPKIVYVNSESPKPTYIESPRVTYRPKPPQAVVVKQTLKPLESQPQQKPLQKIILENRSKPRNNYRREIEKIEIRDKPLPNRNIIHGNTVVYK